MNAFRIFVRKITEEQASEKRLITGRWVLKRQVVGMGVDGTGSERSYQCRVLVLATLNLQGSDIRVLVTYGS
jgi:hypothetical protein